MASVTNNLQLGSVYITISVPPLLAYQKPSTLPYPTHLAPDSDVTNYELECAHGLGNEEFDWGIFFHQHENNGTWYTLQRVSPTGINHMMPMPVPVPMAPTFQVVKRYVSISSLRLNHHVVGLIRVLAVPPEANTDVQTGGLRPYLDWLTANMAVKATRSFLWVVGAFVRCRQHVAKAHGLDDPGTFNISCFLHEALTFAYHEVWYGLCGQLPRPVISSELGTALVLDEGDGGNRHEEGGRNGGRAPTGMDFDKHSKKVLDVTDENQWPTLGSKVTKTK